MNEIIKILESIYSFKITATEKFIRNDDDEVINLFLTTSDNKNLFLKEIQAHSFREDLDTVYSNISKIKADQFSLVLPIIVPNTESKFVLEINEKNFLLFPKIEINPFDPNAYPLSKLLSNLLLFQDLIAPYQFPKQSFRSYESWINMGIKRICTKFGDDITFLNDFKNFMESRFPLLELPQANIHWDIYQDNLGLDKDGKLILLDFDLVQEGAAISDLIGAASIYIDWERPYSEIDPKLLDELMRVIKTISTKIEEEDLKYLLMRTHLGDLALENDIGKVREKLSTFALSLRPKR